MKAASTGRDAAPAMTPVAKKVPCLDNGGGEKDGLEEACTPAFMVLEVVGPISNRPRSVVCDVDVLFSAGGDIMVPAEAEGLGNIELPANASAVLASIKTIPLEI